VFNQILHEINAYHQSSTKTMEQCEKWYEEIVSMMDDVFNHSEITQNEYNQLLSALKGEK
jgi:hypothetical protein